MMRTWHILSSTATSVFSPLDPLRSERRLLLGRPFLPHTKGVERDSVLIVGEGPPDQCR